MFIIVSIVVPVVVYLLATYCVRKYGGDTQKYQWILALACLLFLVSWYLPSPLIDGQDTSFTTHFVGGGIFSGLLCAYIKQALRMRGPWWVELAILFAVVSALGCINELFELVAVQFGLIDIPLDDTSWDIVANTLGACAVFAGYIVSKMFRGRDAIAE